jgi:MFS family permease
MSETATQHPLRNTNFRLLWMGSGISSIGDQFYMVALPWLILQLTGSGAVLGGIMMIGAVPRSVLMLVGGAVTDRISPRKIMMATASCRTVLVAAIATLLWTQRLGLWQLYALVFFFGVADAFAAPAAQTLLPSLVEPEQLPAANSVSQGTTQLAMLVAPAPAGIIVNALGIAWAFFIDAVSFLFILAALWKLPDPPQASLSVPRKNMFREILDGLLYVKNDVALRSLLLVTAVLNFCIAGPFSVGIAFLAKKQFGSPTAFGLLVSSLAAGGLAGMLLAGVWKLRKRGLLLLVGCAFIGICLSAIGLFHHLWLLALLLFVMSAASGFINVQLMSWFQQRIDRAMLGRVMSVLIFAVVGLAPFSLAAAGVAIQSSLPGMFAVAGAAVVVVTLVAATQRPVRQIE